MKKLMMILTLIMVLGSQGFAAEKAPEKKKEGNKIMINTQAHPFTLVSSQRRYKSLKKIVKENKGKVIFLNFFTTSCKLCVKERTQILAIAKKHTEVLPIFIAVRNPKDESITDFTSKIKTMIEKEGIKHDVLLDLYSTVAKFYHVKEGNSIRVPQLFMIDTNTGNVTKVIEKYEEKLEAEYLKLKKKSGK